MLENSFTYCTNKKCSKKDSCLRYSKLENISNGKTYLTLTEQQCKDNNSYINKDDYYKDMIINIINRIPDDELDKKLILQSCYSLLDIAEIYGLSNKLKNKIKELEN